MIPVASPRRRSGYVIPYTLPTAAPWNAPMKAIIPTYDGSGQGIHTSVIDFRHITGSTWNGWRYWMAMTPYTNNSNVVENPSIVVSRNGYEWFVPDGLTNPIYPKPATGYNSDPHIHWDADTNEIVMIYRSADYVIPDTNPARYITTLYVARSSDGITWPATATSTNVTEAGSPAIMKVDGTWVMFSTDGITQPHVIQRRTSSDAITWSEPQQLHDLNTVPYKWHLDCQYIDGVYRMLIDRGPEFLTTSDGLRAASSIDGLGWSVAPVDFMVLDPTHDWEATELYRAVIQPHEDKTHFRLWYSSQGPYRQWWTSFTQVRRDVWPDPPAPQ